MQARCARTLFRAGIAALALAPLCPRAEESAGPTILPPAVARDVSARGRLFRRGIPVSPESFSPDGFHLAYLHHIPGGMIRRKPQRCAFLLDLGTGENRPVKTPKGVGVRIGGWDPTGRYLLIESVQPHLLSSLTGAWTTYHWVFDVVTSEFIPRKPFTGRRDGKRFLWKYKGTYHGVWNGAEDAKVWPLYEGELVELRQAREADLSAEDTRRQEMAARLAVGTPAGPMRELGPLLARLDAHWTRRGHRDPVISELFGERPSLFVLREGEWVDVHREVEHIAVLDRGLVLVTGYGGRQRVLHLERWELLPLPAPPEGFPELLRERWHRTTGFYDEFDPLPRDMQYRRSYDESQGIAYYFNYATPKLAYLLLLYSWSPEKRVLRITELPASWRTGSR